MIRTNSTYPPVCGTYPPICVQPGGIYPPIC